MNVIFLTITPIEDFSSPSVHIGVLKKFRDEGNNVYIVTPYERKTGKKSKLVNLDGVHILHVRTGNITKCGMIEKGITTLAIDKLYIYAINKYFKDIKFDPILYSTPPITLYGAIKKIKSKHNVKSYLMLKDIFPQNAVDIGLIEKKGIKGLIYKYFRKKEIKLYKISDYIGCMSQANVDYVLNHNEYIKKECVEICPNTIDIIDKSINYQERAKIRKKYNIPENDFVFVYGGNLGKPQGIPFLIKCLDKTRKLKNVTFLIVGDGTEYARLDDYIHRRKCSNIMLQKRLPKDDYDILVASCDVGMIFLDHRFTIPNFPSRLLSYMQAKIPVLAVTDPNTDIGKTIVEGGFGWWCESNDENGFVDIVLNIINQKTDSIREIEFEYLKNNYSSGVAYSIISSHLKNVK